MQRILIIEDDSVTARIYRAVLENREYQVEVSSNGASGIQRLIEFRPDGLLLDLMLPDSDGLELLKSLRNLDCFDNLPVIVYTNAFVPHMVEAVHKAGATCVFDKSIMTPLMLVEAFRESLRVMA